VDVGVRDTSSELVFEVSDDGAGFEPSAGGYGTGLQGIADRLGVLDGTMAMRSSVGEGTTIVGRIPLAHGADA
jgi:signal transduction histidine kinase